MNESKPHHAHAVSTLSVEASSIRVSALGTESFETAASPQETTTTTPLRFLAIQPLALVDHIAVVTPSQVQALLGHDAEIGGSRRISSDKLTELLSQVDFHTSAGGAASNVACALAAIGNVNCGLLGARGADEWGSIFAGSMARHKVDCSRMRRVAGMTGRCLVLSSKGIRTMRTVQNDDARITADQLSLDDFEGADWVFISGYAWYGADLVGTALRYAKQAGARIALDLASFEVVRANRTALIDLLSHDGIEAARIDLLIGNEEEALEFLHAPDGSNPLPEAAASKMAQYAQIAVVTLGERGCVVALHEETEPPQHFPAHTSNVHVVDTTGAGDNFTAGFIYGLMKQYPVSGCVRIATLAAAAVVQVVGSDVSESGWAWFHTQLHGERAASVVRESVDTVRAELQACYDLIQRLGRGLVFYGSARTRPGQPHGHWESGTDLAQRLWRLLNVTCWTGGGPGLMEAASKATSEVGGRVGGIRISREAGTRVLTSTYLPADGEVVCKYLAPRKVGLTDAGVRRVESERTAYIFFPGGLGTFDELFELLTIAQLRKLGTNYPVPIVVMNYAGFYDSLVSLLRSADRNGCIHAEELHMVVVCKTNDEAEDYLKSFYGLPGGGVHQTKIHRVSSWIQHVQEDGVQTETSQ